MSYSYETAANMIDTVKLLLRDDQYDLSDGNELCFPDRTYGMLQLKRNPSANEMRAGMYLPRLTHTRRPSQAGIQNALTVEFSAPKLIYGNNFDELTDDDFDAVTAKVMTTLAYMGVTVSISDIKTAKVVGWHPSKNIVYHDYFATQTVINTLRKADISRVYDVRKTNFTDGEVLHFHCNSKDIAFYDKLADLRKSKTSDKRAVENDSRIQRDLIDVLTNIKPLDILRFEIRFNGAAAVRRAIKPVDQTDVTFEHAFNSALSQKVILEHWRTVTKGLDYLALDTERPLKVLQSYLAANPDISPMSACAAVMAMIVASDSGTASLRYTLDSYIGRHFWPRLKVNMQSTPRHQVEHIRLAEQALELFEPTRINAFAC